MSEHRLQELLGQLEAPAALRSAARAQHDDARHRRALSRRIGGVPRRRRVAVATRVALVAVFGLFVASGAVWTGLRPAAAPVSSSVASRVDATEGRVWLRRGGHSLVAARDLELFVADRIELEPGASGTIDVADRTEVKLSGGATLELVELGAQRERLRLAAGRGHFVVGLPRRALYVDSPHLVVEVTGTQFTVAVESERSCVIVHSGHVLVTARATGRQVALGSDQAFSSDGKTCTRLPVVEWVAAPVDDEPRPEAAASSSTAAVTTAAAERRPRGQPPRSTLQEENGLLLAAIAARRAGHPREARQNLERLLTRYPDTPLRAAAERELERVAQAEGARAASAATAGSEPN